MNHLSEHLLKFAGSSRRLHALQSIISVHYLHFKPVRITTQMVLRDNTSSKWSDQHMFEIYWPFMVLDWVNKDLMRSLHSTNKESRDNSLLPCCSRSVSQGLWLICVLCLWQQRWQMDNYPNCKHTWGQYMFGIWVSKRCAGDKDTDNLPKQ